MTHDDYLTRLFEARAALAEDCPDCYGDGCEECDGQGVIDGSEVKRIDKEIADIGRFEARYWSDV